MSRPVAERAVAIARRWIGTPYRHQASAERHGCDCLGLVRGIWREIHGAEPVAVPGYSADWSEPQRDEALWQAAAVHLVERPAAAAAGSILLFRMRQGAVAKHVGVMTDDGAAPRFVHAYQGHGVIESPLSLPWRRRVVAAFDFPEETS